MSTIDFITKTSHKCIYRAFAAFAEAFALDSADVFFPTLETAINGAIKKTSDASAVMDRLQQWQEDVKTDRFRMVVERYFARQVRRPTEVAKARRSPRTLNKGPASCSTSVTEDELRVDGLTLKRGTETIGQRIKEAALELDLLAETGFASVHQRRVYALGGSSILDLVDRSPESQLHQVFSDSTERDELLAMFRHLRVFKSSKFQEPVELLAHWDVVMAFARSGGLSAARSYLFREMAACVPDKVNDLWLLLIMVDALINNQHLFLGKVDITEADFLNVLWQPLLSRLFYERQGETDLRLKTGESTAAASNFEKRRFYEDSGALAFKIDVRIIQDHAVEGEIDLAAVEVARNYQDVKIFADGTKVLREAKGVVDRLAQIFPDNKDFPRRTVGLGMQISCLTGIVFSVHLVAPRLYVAWPEYRFALPSSVGTLHLFTDVIRAFTLFRNTLQQTTAHVKSALASKRSIEALYGYIDTEEPLGRKSWVSGNWFTPPKSVKTKSIKHLIKVPFPVQTILDARSEGASAPRLHEKAQFDENGWAVVDVGAGVLKFFNKYTLKYLDERGGKKPRLTIE